ncbi:MAG: hypothetical protein AB1641_09810 [Thermodesulfobacteriota bacterium]
MNDAVSRTDRLFYLQELKSEECRCGRPKKRGQSLCSTCYYRLPEPLRFDLYLPVGGGYEGAYEAAVAYLDTFGGDE